MFAQEGVPVHDADAVVHALYRGAAVAPVEAAFPGVSVSGAIDRGRLSTRVLGDPAGLQLLESIVHPLVRAERDAFLKAARARREPVVVLDIPLLFETDAHREVDRIVVVSAPEAVQNARVLARPGMTEERLSAILAKQLPDADKRRRADAIIDTGSGFEVARAQVRAIVADARAEAG